MVKNNKSYIKLHKYSPLISETLPYEVPMKFSNRLLFNRLQKLYDDKVKDIVKIHNTDNTSGITFPLAYDFFEKNYLPKQIIQFIERKKFFIPYKYKINKDTLNKRQISLIHPISQFKVCDFYDKYAQLILYYCNKSSYSLRHPYRKTSIVHKKYSHLLSKFIIQNDSQDAQVKNIYEEIEEDAENLKPEDFLTNYFIYKKYNMLYKFYNSDEYIDLEKKYKYLLKLDISRCFDSIYTHSISWSVKSKDYVKNNLAKLDKENCFSDEFDNLMQSSNYLETNGIPIGAEVSRIFAEIILQRIDNQIHQRVNKNLAIRRYVDDYYIFFNDINQLDIIEGIIKEELEEYKFSINKNKRELLNHPFITIETFVKNKISDIMKVFEDSCFYIDENTKRRNVSENHSVSSRRIIKEIRDILYYEKIDPTKISGIVLSKLQKILIEIYLICQTSTENINIDNIKNVLLEILKICFYIVNISVKCETTYKLVKIVYLAITLAKKTTEVILMSISDYIFSEINSIFEVYESTKLPTEFLDLITILNEIARQENYKISPQRLERLFRLDVPNDEYSIQYFEIVILLDYIQNDILYADVKEKLLTKIKSKLRKSHNFIVTEDFLTFFDLVKCPFIDGEIKKEILQIYGISKDKTSCIQEIIDKEWFFDWNINFDINEILSIKELNFNSY